MARKSIFDKTRAKEGPGLQAVSSKGSGGKPPSTIVFFHPDLGIGGAERLVVDAAVGLQERGYRVVIFTNHCDPGHCFDECRDGTLDVRVRAAGPVPMSVFNRLTILCAILRHIQLLLLISLTGELAALNPRALIVDQLSAGLPLLTWLCPTSPILFYCHFPDMLLARGRESTIKRLYRIPFDALEQWSMGSAQAVAVNSEFTRGVVGQTWPGLKQQTAMRVVYPCVDVGKDKEVRGKKGTDKVLEGEKVILSINRFEEKKDIGLAVRAFAGIPEEKRKGVRLVIAGGYDPRIDENVQYHKSLQNLADSLSLPHATITASEPLSSAPSVSAAPVLFLLSVPSETKAALLRTSRLLVYTPSAEHFGIVPLEAMRARLPVLAATTGGPVETVVDGQTGWLRPTTDVDAWSEVMAQALGMTDAEAKAMGEAGAARVRQTFGRDKMAERLDEIVDEITRMKPAGSAIVTVVMNLLVVALAFVVGIVFAKGFYTVKETFLEAWHGTKGEASAA